MLCFEKKIDVVCGYYSPPIEIGGFKKLDVSLTLKKLYKFFFITIYFKRQLYEIYKIS